MRPDDATPDEDNPRTPLEQTLEPVDLEALREAAREAGGERIPRPRSRPNLDPHVDTESYVNDDTEMLTPLEPTLQPGEMEALRALAQESSHRRTQRPRSAVDLDSALDEPHSLREPAKANVLQDVPKEVAPEIPMETEAPLVDPPVASAKPQRRPVSDATLRTAPPLPPAPKPPAPKPPELRQPVAAASSPPMPSPSVEKSRMWQMVVPTAFLLAVVMLLANILPLVLVHFRLAEANAEAEAIYLKRRAELKAEAEFAAQQLAAIDQKVGLVSLGFRHVVGKVSPSVVNIANLRDIGKKDDPLAKGPLTYDSDKDRKYNFSGMGSGVLIKPGYLMTNHHVVQGADRLRIIFASGRVIGVDGSAVVTDPITDLAIIKLPTDVSEPLKEDMKQTVVFADTDKDVAVGDWALAIGSPLGLRQTVTVGIISAKDRLIDKLDMVELLQTDAAINPGNSGGPLFDQLGRVVGINVAIVNENGVNRGIGFAIPSNTANKIANALIERGEVVRGYVGVGMEEFPSSKAKVLGVDGGAVMVMKVIPGQPGDQAGLKVGDVIAKFNGQPLQHFQAMRHLRQLIVDAEPGKEATFEVYRENARSEVKVAIGKRPVLTP